MSFGDPVLMVEIIGRDGLKTVDRVRPGSERLPGKGPAESVIRRTTRHPAELRDCHSQLRPAIDLALRLPLRAATVSAPRPPIPSRNGCSSRDFQFRAATARERCHRGADAPRSPPGSSRRPLAIFDAHRRAEGTSPRVPASRGRQPARFRAATARERLTAHPVPLPPGEGRNGHRGGEWAIGTRTERKPLHGKSDAKAGAVQSSPSSLQEV
jgi:hypothetical protein